MRSRNVEKTARCTAGTQLARAQGQQQRDCTIEHVGDDHTVVLNDERVRTHGICNARGRRCNYRTAGNPVESSADFAVAHRKADASQGETEHGNLEFCCGFSHNYGNDTNDEAPPIGRTGRKQLDGS
jgi:hypothetical protein